MKKCKKVNNLTKIFFLCAITALGTVSFTACADKTEDKTVTIEQLVKANDRQQVIEKYGNLHIMQTSAYESGETYTANVVFYANDYGMVMDYLDEKSDGSTYFSTTVMNGMMYIFNNSTKGVFYSADLYDDNEYNAKVNSIYNLNQSDVIKDPEFKDGKIVVETECEYALLDYSEKSTLYFNAETLLIERATTQYTIEMSNMSETSSNEVIYEYGCSDYVPVLTAYNAHKNSKEKSNFIVVRNAGAANEKRTEYTIANESGLYIADGEGKDYALFENASCTNKIDDINQFIANNANPILYLGEDKHYSEKYSAAVRDAVFAEESEIRDLVTLTTDDERVSWNEEGKVLLLTFHKYPDSYVEGETFTTGSWYMWTVTDGEIIDWYAKNQCSASEMEVKLKQVLGMPVSSANTHISAVWVDVSDVIRPAYQIDPTKQLTADDFDGSSLGVYKDWFNSNILSSYFSVWGQYPWTRLGYTYDWGSDDEYGLTEFLILQNSTIEVEFTMSIDEFAAWLYEKTASNES